MLGRKFPAWFLTYKVPFLVFTWSSNQGLQMSQTGVCSGILDIHCIHQRTMKLKKKNFNLKKRKRGVPCSSQKREDTGRGVFSS